MQKSRPVRFECRPQCQFHCNSLKRIIILAFAPTVLSPVTLCFLSGSLDSVNYTKKFQKNSRLSYSTYKKPRYQQQQSPRRRTHDRAEDVDRKVTCVSMMLTPVT